MTSDSNSKANPDHFVIPARNTLAAKVPSGGGPSLSNIVKAAQDALEDLRGNFDQWIREDLASLDAAFEQARAAPEGELEGIRKLRGVGHDIKGHGGTFDYLLLTEIADSLCRMIRTDEAAAARELDLVKLHVDALHMVVDHDIRGHGGAQGQELVNTLRVAVDKLFTGHGASEARSQA